MLLVDVIPKVVGVDPINEVSRHGTVMLRTGPFKLIDRHVDTRAVRTDTHSCSRYSVYCQLRLVLSRTSARRLDT